MAIEHSINDPSAKKKLVEDRAKLYDKKILYLLMVFFEDHAVYESRARQAIARYGYAPEHQFDWYLCNTEPNEKAVYVEWPDGTALLTFRAPHEWYVFSEPLAPLESAGARIAEFAKRALEEFGIKKVVLELRAPTRKAVLTALPETLRARNINYAMVWPVMDIDRFDPSLPGGHWKHIRNARNGFYRERAVTITDARTIAKEKLHGLIDRWRAQRGGHDKAFFIHYKNAVDKKFSGAGHAHAMIIDNTLVGLNAGWRVPNSNQYYAGIGIHDYSLQDLGIMLYLADLEFFKKEGLKIVDMAGGEKALTNFKNQFLPARSYKTFVFSIVKK